MKSWTIRQRILGSFGGILAIMLMVGAIAFAQLQRIDRDADVIATDSVAGLIQSNRLLVTLLDEYVLLQRHVGFNDRAAGEKFEAFLVSNRALKSAQFSKYESTIFQPEDRLLFDAFKATVGPYWALQDRVLKLGPHAAREDVLALMDNELDPAFAKTRAALRVVVERNERYTADTVKTIDASIKTGELAILLGIALIAASSLAAGFFLLRAITSPLQRLLAALDVIRQGDFTGRIEIQRDDEFGVVAGGFNRMTDELAALVGQVQKSGLQVTTSVSEVAATARQQHATATEIAATTAEIGATSRVISETSMQLVRTMNDVADVAEQSALLADNGQTGLSHMGQTMAHVMEATKAITTRLVVLSEKASNINQVITTISRVAEQTNLLSLNAAIEAEKAGEHGRGFSVVAMEIRRLADQTAVATYDIGQTVKEIQTAVSASVMGMDKFSDEVRRGIEEVQHISGQLSQIIVQVQTLAPRVEDVNEGMQAQAAAAEQITQALVQLNESAKQTVESLGQSAMAIDDLNQAATGLRGGVSRFKVRL